MMLAPINTADKVYTIDPTSVAVGALAANSWAGFDSPAQQVITTAGSRYVAGLSSDPWSDTAFVTKASGRDQEVSFKMSESYQGCTVYLRYDGESAVNFAISKGGNTFKANFVRYVGRINQLKDVGNDTYVENALGLSPGGTSLSALVGSTFARTDVWTFGASGDTFYAKLNGVEFWSKRFWTHAKPGKIAVLFESNGGIGYRDVTCTFKPNAVTYSDFDNLVLDPRDWGLKDKRTTGSITGGSYTLTVADATGFEIGDTVCIETGKEAGGGVFGTEGVGGTWPTQGFANYASLPDPAVFRATDNPTDTDLYVWLRDTNKVWINYRYGAGGPPTWGEFSPDTQDYYYYHNMIQPRALCAKITAKSGNTLTLDKAAAVTTTDANVYIDCTPAWQAIKDGNATIGTLATSFGATHPDWYSVRKFVTIRFPPGQYVLRKLHVITTTYGWTVRGETADSTVILSPEGSSDFWVYQYGAKTTWHDLTFVGNGADRGFCHENDKIYQTIDWTLNFYGNRQNGINGEFGSEAYNLKFLNTFGGVGCVLNHYSHIHDCSSIHNKGNLQRYLTWFFASGYCIQTFYENITYTADKIGNAFEIFQAEGGGFINCTAINGYFSSNYSGGDYLWENCTSIIDLNETPTRDWTSSNGAIFNINVNIGSGAQTGSVIFQGGRIKNPTIKITQRRDNNLIRAGIALNAGCVNMRITGTHPEKNGKGRIDFIRTTAGEPSIEYFGIRADSPAVIEGIRVTGGGSDVAGRSNIHGHIGVGGSYKNNVTDSIWAINTATSTWYNIQDVDGNISNAEYEALP